eukprot:14328690-Alexandrium_andersonii.AAC.1
MPLSNPFKQASLFRLALSTAVPDDQGTAILDAMHDGKSTDLLRVRRGQDTGPPALGWFFTSLQSMHEFPVPGKGITPPRLLVHPPLLGVGGPLSELTGLAMFLEVHVLRLRIGGLARGFARPTVPLPRMHLGLRALGPI